MVIMHALPCDGSVMNMYGIEIVLHFNKFDGSMGDSLLNSCN